MQCVKDGLWKKDEALAKELDDLNKKQLEALEAKIKDAEENLGESELREALLNKAEYLTKIGNKEAAETAIRKVRSKALWSEWGLKGLGK